MTRVFTFPGQGSQAVGMGQALAENSTAAKQVFAEVDEALGQNLSRLIWDGPLEELTLTANAQPALMAPCGDSGNGRGRDYSGRVGGLCRRSFAW